MAAPNAKIPWEDNQFSTSMWDTPAVRITVWFDEHSIYGQDFFLPREVLAAYSKVFYDQLYDGKLDTLTIENDDPLFFRTFYKWTQTGRFKDQPTDPDSREHLLDMWEWGRQWKIPEMQNAIVDTLIRMMKDGQAVFSPNFIRSLFAKTSPQCPLRRQVADMHAEILGRGKPVEVDDVEEFVTVAGELAENGPDGARLAEALLKFEQPEWKCKWHVHPVGEDCSTIESP